MALDVKRYMFLQSATEIQTTSSRPARNWVIVHRTSGLILNVSLVSSLPKCLRLTHGSKTLELIDIDFAARASNAQVSINLSTNWATFKYAHESEPRTFRVNMESSTIDRLANLILVKGLHCEVKDSRCPRALRELVNPTSLSSPHPEVVSSVLKTQGLPPLACSADVIDAVILRYRRYTLKVNASNNSTKIERCQELPLTSHTRVTFVSENSPCILVSRAEVVLDKIQSTHLRAYSTSTSLTIEYPINSGIIRRLKLTIPAYQIPLCCSWLNLHGIRTPHLPYDGSTALTKLATRISSWAKLGSMQQSETA